MSTLNLIDYSVIVLYLGFSIYVGCRCVTQQKTTEDYFLAGRSMNWWPIAISIFASLFSSISFIAMPGEAYNYGCNMWLGGVVGIIALPGALFIFLKFFYKMRLFTVNEYLERRFSSSIRTINSLLFLGLRGLYLGVVLYATGILLKSVFGWPMWISILIIGGFSTIYTYYGGMAGVIWTDVLQFVVLVGGILTIIGVIAYETPGHLSGIWTIATEHGRGFDLGMSSGIWNFDLQQRIVVWIWLIGLPFAMIGPATDQMNLQRCLSCKSFREVTIAVSTSTIGGFLVCFIFYFAGMALFVYFKVLHSDTLPQNLNGDDAFGYFSAHILPLGLRGLLIAGLLAAVMSTISSVINSLCAVFVKDIYQPLLHPEATDTHCLKVAHRFTLWCGIFSCLFGLAVVFGFSGREIPLLEVSNVCLGVIGAFASAIFVAGLLTYRINSKAMLLGIIAGVPVSIYLTFFRYLLLPPPERIGFMYLGLIPFFAILLVAYLAGWIFNPQKRIKFPSCVIWNRYAQKPAECESPNATTEQPEI